MHTTDDERTRQLRNLNKNLVGLVLLVLVGIAYYYGCIVPAKDAGDRAREILHSLPK